VKGEIRTVSSWWRRMKALRKLKKERTKM
jgi:hypothetical protein